MTRPLRVVRDLWSADQLQGLETLLAAADDDIVWQPHLVGRRVFRTTTELRRALSTLAESGFDYEAQLEAIEEHDGVVVASGTLRTLHGGQVDERLVHAAYHFRDGRLTRQASHESRRDALDSITALRAVAAPLASVEEVDGPDGVRVVRVHGELDIANVAELEAVLGRPRPPGERVVLDLARLHFMDSTGLRGLVRAVRSARDGGWELTVRNVHRNVERLFELSGVRDALPVEAPAEPHG